MDAAEQSEMQAMLGFKDTDICGVIDISGWFRGTCAPEDDEGPGGLHQPNLLGFRGTLAEKMPSAKS